MRVYRPFGRAPRMVRPLCPGCIVSQASLGSRSRPRPLRGRVVVCEQGDTSGPGRLPPSLPRRGGLLALSPLGGFGPSAGGPAVAEGPSSRRAAASGNRPGSWLPRAGGVTTPVYTATTLNGYTDQRRTEGRQAC